MASLSNQKSAFKASLVASSGAPNKVITTPQSRPSPSPGPSQASNPNTKTNDLKRKRPEATNVVYSQPDNTGTGKNTMVQITYATEFLKSKGYPQALKDILDYLSLQHEQDGYKRTITTILRNHPKVIFDSARNTYSYRPLHDIRSEEGLLGYLQSQHTAQGLNVRELRDGWAGAEDAINKLEREGRLLATRNKKDNHAKMVWPDDPSLKFTIDSEFQDVWHKIKMPDAAAVADALEREGLTPANKTRHVKKAPTVQEQKKKKAPRKGGKTTNKHMEGILRDYTHLRK